MAEGKIIRLGGGSPLVIEGQEIVTGEYQENIDAFDTISIQQGDIVPTKLSHSQGEMPQFANTTEMDLSPDDIHLAVAHTQGFIGDLRPITIYKRSGDNFTKLPNPSPLPAGPNGTTIQFSPEGVHLVVGHVNAPHITIYKRNGDNFTKLSDPAILPTGGVNRVRFSPDGVHLIVGHTNFPFITIYKRNGDTFTKLTNPSTLPPSQVFRFNFSSNGLYLALPHDDTPFFTIYKRDGDTFTKLTDPSNLPNKITGEVVFSPDDTYLAAIEGGNTFDGGNLLMIYKRNGDSFTRLQQPDVMPEPEDRGSSIIAVGARYVRFTPDNSLIILSFTTPPHVFIYKQTNDIFIKTGEPEWGANVNIGFSSNGTYIAATKQTVIQPDPPNPNLMLFKRSEDTFIDISGSLIQPLSSQTHVVFSSNDTYLISNGIAISQGYGPTFYKNETPLLINKANNIIDLETDKLGYALEDGTTGETKEVMSLFGVPTEAPTGVLLEAVPTGQISFPPPVFLRVAFTNPINQTVDVEALLFRASDPENLIGVNNLPTTLGPNETFGPSDVATAGGNSGLHILTVRIKEPGKLFSTIVQDSVNLEDSGGGFFL